MKPNFFVVGGARCGTTSFVRYLRQHPDVFIAPVKETHYFASQEMPLRYGDPIVPGAPRLEDRIVRTEVEYQRLFTEVQQEAAIGEASVYYLFYATAAERINLEVPDSKIVILLRNPIERAYSAYGLLTRDHTETRSFEQSLALEPERRLQNFEPIWYYTEVGLYARQVERYLHIFGRERVHIILTDDLDAHIDTVMGGAFRFLGVRPDFRVDTSLRVNSGGIPRSSSARRVQDIVFSSNRTLSLVKALIPAELRMRWGHRVLSAVLEYPEMAHETRLRLWDVFADDIAQLERLLNRELNQWEITQTETKRT